MTDLAFLSLTEVSALIAARQISPVDIVREHLSRIEQDNGILRAYLTVCGEASLTQAKAIEREIGRGGVRGPLHGIPISHKDVIFTAGIRTTAHSRSLLDFVPSYDAAVVGRLADAGMIVLGKTNTTEFAFGGMEVFGTARNPWNPVYYTGGSSGGSAGAVAAGLAVAATGTDSLGSIRVPASFCGAVGLKPSFGRVSRYGVTPLGWSLDHVGPITRTVRDSALLMNVMAGHDPRDLESANTTAADFTSELSRGVDGCVLGIPDWSLASDVHPETAQRVREALEQFERLGASIEPIRLRHPSELAPAGWLILMVEGFAAHRERLRRAAPSYGIRIRRRLCTGSLFRAVHYQTALRIRRAFTAEVERALERVDVLVTPTVPFPAFTVAAQEENPPDSSIFTCPFNLSGHPAISIPCGFTREGLPVGLQLVGKLFGEASLLRVAHAYEEAMQWYRQRPRPLESAERFFAPPAPVATTTSPIDGALLRWVEAETVRYGLALEVADLETIGMEYQRIEAALADQGGPTW